MPERLQAHNVSWKVYTAQESGGQFDNVLPYFRAYNKPGSKLAKLGVEPHVPGTTSWPISPTTACRKSRG